jgi:hypothetical protein
MSGRMTRLARTIADPPPRPADAGVTRLRIDDEAFLVASLIERCPKVMMLRELVQNALEAAQLAEPGERRVDIRPHTVDGVRKLAIVNSGPGMSATELFRMCDLAASLGKEKALDRNFGMGAKVASLPANRLGMRYRSCQGGRVHEVVIGKRGGVYGRVRRSDPLTLKPVDVADVTGAAMAEGLPLDRDWTEVVLLGNRPDQDTLVDPFDGEPEVGSDWLAEGLYHRFYRMPEEIEVRLHPGTHRLDGVRRFRPIAARARDFARYEAVPLDDGTVLHFLLDPPDPDGEGRNCSEVGALQTGAGIAAVVYRDEMYDIRHGWMWSLVGPQFGLSFGVRHVSVHVELPPGSPVLPDAYRQFLRYTGAEQKHVEVTDFAARVAAHRPAWLIEALRALGPETRIAESLRDELGGLLRGLGVRRAIRGSRGPAADDADGAPTAIREQEPRERDTDADGIEAPPEIVLLRDQRHVRDRLLDGRAAGYDAASHELFVNMRYAAFARMADALRAEFAVSSDPIALDGAVTAAVEETMVRRIGRALVHGLSKRDIADGWNRWQLQAAISPEALTLAADDYVWSIPDARAHVSRSLEGGAR